MDASVVDRPLAEMSLESVLGLFRRRKWLIIGTSALGTALMVLAGSQITPRYTAKALLMIEPPEADLIGSQQTLPVDIMTVETQVKVLNSRRHLQGVIQQVGLDADPEFLSPEDAPAGSPSFLARAGQLASRLQGAWLVAAWGADPLPGRLEAPGPSLATGASALPVVLSGKEERALDSLAGRLRITQEGRSYVIGVSFNSTGPDRAARIANAVAGRYVDDRLAEKRAEAGRTLSWLTDRIATLKGEVERAEAAVEQYRLANNLVAAGRTDVNDAQIADLNNQLVAAQTQLTGREARLAYIRGVRRGGQSLDSLPEVLSSPLIIDLRRQEAELARSQAELAGMFGERHPRMRHIAAERQRVSEKIDNEINRIIANLGNEVQIAAAQVASIQRGLTAAQAVSATAQGAEVRLRELEREAQASRQLYESLLQRYKEARERQDIIQPGARVISAAAAPTTSTTPGTPLLAVLGFTVSTALGTMLALARDRFDRGLRSQGEIMAALGLRRIALVPRLHGHRRPHRYLVRRPRSAYTESMRAIFASLRLASDAKPPKVIMVTSSVPGEGKTTLAISLAAYAAMAGHRVVIVDLDLRCPAVARELQVPVSADIVGHVLYGLPLDEAVRRDGELDLDVIGVREQAIDPMSLLTGRRLGELLDQLRRSYDYVLVDSPPLLVVTDAQLLAPQVDTVLLAVQWGATTKALAQNAVGLLRTVHADVAGVVLTRVDMEKHALYGFGDVGEYGKHAKYYKN